MRQISIENRHGPTYAIQFSKSMSCHSREATETLRLNPIARQYLRTSPLDAPGPRLALPVDSTENHLRGALERASQGRKSLPRPPHVVAHPEDLSADLRGTSTRAKAPCEGTTIIGGLIEEQNAWAFLRSEADTTHPPQVCQAVRMVISPVCECPPKAIA